jgi:hypothetical protein
MAGLSCETHHVELFDKGGTVRVGVLDNLALVRWERQRDDISFATVWVEEPSNDCLRALERMEPNRTEMVVFRGGQRVWEGPITRVQYGYGRVEIEARDILHYLYRAVMRSAYDNRYPNTTTVIQRVVNVLTTELARQEALDPAINVLPFLDARTSGTDTRTARRTEAWEYTVFEHMDELAARAGMDYTVVGRSLVLLDARNRLGTTPKVGREDFIGEVVVSYYGMEGATFAAVTDGQGNAGTFGGVDGYYGLIEILDTAYDEEQDEGEPPSVEEMASQARRNMGNRLPTPLEVRIPDNTQLNPNGSLKMEHLVPATWVPLQVDVPGKRISQMQKIDFVRWNETPSEGERVTLTLSPAPRMDDEIEEE